MEEKKKTMLDDVNNLCRKSDQTRTIHNMIKCKYEFWNNLILFYVTIGSAITALLIFVELSRPNQIYLGLFSASIFLVSLIPGTFNFSLKISERSMAVNLWGKWFRSAKGFCNVEIHSLDNDALTKRYDEILNNYKDTMDSTCLIPDNKFNKYKRKHLQKLEISKALDKTPFKSITRIKLELWLKQNRQNN